MVVAIDGPSGSGKSTVARLLAARLGLPVLDTGAMYRALALAVLEAGVDPDDRGAVAALAERARIDVERRPDGSLEVRLDGRPVGGRIRTPRVSDATSRISVYPEVRRRMVALQRRVAARAGAVVEGRDIGTVVFPHTPHKFFLRAHPRVRAARRHRQLAAAGEAVDPQLLEDEIARRDRRDATRAASPLTCDDSYLVIDTSDLPPESVVERMLEHIGSAAASRTP
ncbi:MAG: (d)CMP kinase [Acidobacteria bacterium]|nr:MAG: (d)CMP kinase [Acidobacteriota bacterium]